MYTFNSCFCWYEYICLHVHISTETLVGVKAITFLTLTFKLILASIGGQIYVDSMSIRRFQRGFHVDSTSNCLLGPIKNTQIKRVFSKNQCWALPLDL